MEFGHSTEKREVYKLGFFVLFYISKSCFSETPQKILLIIIGDLFLAFLHLVFLMPFSIINLKDPVSIL